MGLELTTDRYPPITSQMRYPLRHAASTYLYHCPLVLINLDHWLVKLTIEAYQNAPTFVFAIKHLNERLCKLTEKPHAGLWCYMLAFSCTWMWFVLAFRFKGNLSIGFFFFLNCLKLLINVSRNYWISWKSASGFI